MCTTLPYPVIHSYEQNETEVLHLSLDHMRIDIMDWTSLFCYSNHMIMISERRRYGRIFFRSMKSFGYSHTQNKSMVIGCCAYACIGNYKYENLSTNYTSGCVCCNGQDSSRPRSCSGIGCCQATFPKDLSTLEIHVGKASKLPNRGGSIVDKNFHDFQKTDPTNKIYYYIAVLNRGIGIKSCQ